MLNFQDMIIELTRFWAEQGCLIHQGYDLEVGAGTFNPATFLRCLGPEPYRAVYVEPSRRPKDGRYGENPNRVQFYHQMQVIIKPSPADLQDLYLRSLERIGLDLNKHDIRFVHDDWENPTIGAWGLGWEVWADGMEVTQFTYFQAVGGVAVRPVSGELTYGLERLAMYIQGVDSIFDLQWHNGVTYGDVFKRSEWEWSHYNFHQADAKMWLKHFENFEAEAVRLVKNNLPIPAYDFVMKASHAFNILDARGVISVTERTGYIGRIRHLANLVAEAYIKSREEQKFPLLKGPLVDEAAKASETVHIQWHEGEKEDFLLEIGSEELPAIFVPIGMQNLENQLKHLLDSHGLKYDHVHVYGTPRRLAARITSLIAGIGSKKIEKRGPAVHVAFDGQGKLTQAGRGFFKSLNLGEENLENIKEKKVAGVEIREIKGTDYLFAQLTTPEISTRKLLAEKLPELILKIDFPKKMRWGASDIEYARPLRWIIALYGSEKIPFHLGNISSGNETYGHRQLSPEKFTVSSALTYLDDLKKHYVLADVEERKASILKQLEEIERQKDAVALAKEKVVPQVLHLVEYPFLTTADFDPLFLKAPKEVLISEMVEHQKYFPLGKKDGSMKNAFVIVCNNKPTDLIRKGNQKALSPRLADGMFLYEEDLKTSLEAFNQKLKAMTFQKELGSMWAKVERLEKFTALLHERLPICSLKKAQRAAQLSKADLASELVGEFPELQGHVGKLYALKHGEDEEVAIAIEEHWMPKGEKAPLPKNGCSILVSLADKVDNLLSCFLLDLKPTSSSDPYALRRQAFGMIKMLIESKAFLRIDDFFKSAFDLFLKNPELRKEQIPLFEAKKNEVLDDIEAFLMNRARTVFADYGFEKDEIEACLSQGLTCCYDIYTKIDSLHRFRKENKDSFLADLEIHTRVKKILFSQNPQLEPSWAAHRKSTAFDPKKRFPPVDSHLFKDESEERLFEKINQAKEDLRKTSDVKKETGDYKKALFLIAELKEPLNVLFEKVKIIEDNLAVRQNRLSLLQEIWDFCEEVFDFSKIQEHENV